MAVKRLGHVVLLILLVSLLMVRLDAFHDCIQASQYRRKFLVPNKKSTKSCAGGLCVGMKNGPHEGGNASYPVAWNGCEATSVKSIMTVPELPKLQDGITYYIWTDVFFGDAGHGRMNQFVPQLILGDALDGSTGPPEYRPRWGNHQTWSFASHYFFELYNPQTNQTESHAAYGNFYPAVAGESIYTKFELSPWMDTGPKWTLTMGIVGDTSRVSILEIPRPYMGMGMTWEEPTMIWTEAPYRNMCINACWELYGAIDSSHLPSSGATYNLTIVQPKSGLYPFTSWEEDEGNGICPSVHSIHEEHTLGVQSISFQIDVDQSQQLES